MPVADSQIRQNQPTKNFGGIATIRVRSGTFRSYLKFNVPALSGTVQSARLRVFVVESSPNAGSAYVVKNGWTETGINWNNAPPISGSPLHTPGAAALGTWVEFTVTSAIISSPTVIFALSGGSTDGVDYSSRTGTNPPQLNISTGP